MGIVPVSPELEAAFDKRGKRLESGTYQGTVTSAKIVVGKDNVWKPWVEAALQFTLETDDGQITHQLELAPLTDKSGQINQKAVNYVGWQLENLGHDTGIGDVEYKVAEIQGARVEFEVEKTEGDINPKSGQPYVNTKVHLVKPLDATASTEGASATEDDDDIPF